MSSDNLVRDLTTALATVPLIDPHSHVEPLRPVARSLDDILGYHYYTELAHSAGMTHAPLAKDYPARDRVRAIVRHMARFDNTTQYGWFVDIARTFLGFDGTRVTEADADRLFDAAERTFTQLDWEQQVITKTNLEKIFLTNEFDDPYIWSERPTGNTATDSTRPSVPPDPAVYVPCLRTDALVFHLDKPDTRQRLAKVTGTEVRDAATLRQAVRRLNLPVIWLHWQTRYNAVSYDEDRADRWTSVEQILTCTRVFAATIADAWIPGPVAGSKTARRPVAGRWPAAGSSA